MIEGVYNPFSQEEYLAGELAPVFFGSALNTFGVKELLECFVQIADGYTLRIKKEDIDTVAKKEIKQNLEIEDNKFI